MLLEWLWCCVVFGRVGTKGSEKKLNGVRDIKVNHIMLHLQ